MADGWVKIYRNLKDKPIWKKSSPEHKTIFITLLLMANHDLKEWEWQGKKFKVNPGQFVTSIGSIIKECGKGISTQNIRSALARFKKLEFLTNESTKTGRLITIINWGSYQHQDKKPTKKPTDSQQRGNKEVTPNKNDKKDKKEPIQKISFLEVVTLTADEHSKLVTKYGKPNTTKAIEILNNYKASSGKKYKSDYHAILSWAMEKVGGNGGHQSGIPTLTPNTCPTCKRVVVAGECDCNRLSDSERAENLKRIENITGGLA